MEFINHIWPVPGDFQAKFFESLDGMLEKCREDLFSGNKVNHSENRAAWHTALRIPYDVAQQRYTGNKLAQIKEIHDCLDKMESIVKRFHRREYLGATGEKIENIIHIGVGGSHLGVRMASYALDEYYAIEAKGINVLFASSMDGNCLRRQSHKLDPAKTALMICSKSFSTLDTMLNVKTAKVWLENSLNMDWEDIAKHHVFASSANIEEMNKWGVAEDKQLPFWEWVGGRLSIWSSVSLVLAIQIGMDNFRKMLAGAHDIDERFFNEPNEENIIVQQAMRSVWAVSNGYHANAILPYDGRLRNFPIFLQQLIMESNGKSVNHNKEQVSTPTSPIIFGGVGSESQHSFYQLLHQGTQKVFCDFILVRDRQVLNQKINDVLIEQHENMLENAIAQCLLLNRGEDLGIDRKGIPDEQSYHGNTPTCMIIVDELGPFELGQLIANYEHRTFVEACIWQINPFDQWGVELGKRLAKTIRQAKESPETASEEVLDLVDVVKGTKRLERVS